MTVFGASRDSVEDNDTFAKNNQFSFNLLCDVDGALCQAYGVCDTGNAQRVTFIIGNDGVIEQVIANIDADKHATTALEYLQK